MTRPKRRATLSLDKMARLSNVSILSMEPGPTVASKPGMIPTGMPYFSNSATSTAARLVSSMLIVRVIIQRHSRLRKRHRLSSWSSGLSINMASISHQMDTDRWWISRGTTRLTRSTERGVLAIILGMNYIPTYKEVELWEYRQDG